MSGALDEIERRVRTLLWMTGIVLVLTVIECGAVFGVWRHLWP